MKKDLNYAYREALKEILEGLDDLMADLEDIRDDAAEMLDENSNDAIQADVTRMDAVISKLAEAADLLETDD